MNGYTHSAAVLRPEGGEVEATQCYALASKTMQRLTRYHYLEACNTSWEGSSACLPPARESTHHLNIISVLPRNILVDHGTNSVSEVVAVAVT